MVLGVLCWMDELYTQMAGRSRCHYYSSWSPYDPMPQPPPLVMSLNMLLRRIAALLKLWESPNNYRLWVAMCHVYCALLHTVRQENYVLV